MCESTKKNKTKMCTRKKGESNEDFIPSLKENAGNRKKPIRHKQLAKCLDVLGFQKRLS